jgi:RND superfamily putative drug exporter
MDYQVFILTRSAGSRPHQLHHHRDHRRHRKNRALVTGAALILFLAFAALSTGPETDLKVMATALAPGSCWTRPSSAPSSSPP